MSPVWKWSNARTVHGSGTLPLCLTDLTFHITLASKIFVLVHFKL